MRQPASVSGLTHLCQPLEAARLREYGIGVAYGGSGGIMSPMPVENTLMSTRPMEKTLAAPERLDIRVLDRKSTRLNSSHVKISYAVFCLKKKKKNDNRIL